MPRPTTTALSSVLVGVRDPPRRPTPSSAEPESKSMVMVAAARQRRPLGPLGPLLRHLHGSIAHCLDMSMCYPDT